MKQDRSMGRDAANSDGNAGGLEGANESFRLRLKVGIQRIKAVTAKETIAP